MSLSFVSTFSYGKDAEQKTSIKPLQLLPSHEEFKKMPLGQQKTLVQLLRIVAFELEMQQKLRHSSTLGDPKKSALLQLWEQILPSSHAIREGKPCINAGHLLTYTFQPGGRLSCPWPESRGCTPSTYIRCHKIFGQGVCVPRSQTVTQSCMNSAKSVEDTVRELQADTSAEGFNAYKHQIQQFCATSGRWECEVIRGRLRDIANWTPSVSSASSATQPPSTPPPAIEPTPAPPPVTPVPPSEVVTAESVPNASGSSGSISFCSNVLPIDRCRHDLLMEEAINPLVESSRIRPDSTDTLVMSPLEAREFMCGQGDPQEFVTRARQRIQRGIHISQNSRKDSTNTDGSEDSRAYYTCFLRSLEANLNFCQQEAHELRNNAQRNFTPPRAHISMAAGGTLRIVLSQPIVRTARVPKPGAQKAEGAYDFAEKDLMEIQIPIRQYTGTHSLAGRYFGSMNDDLRRAGQNPIHICEMQIVTPAPPAPRTGTSSSGATQ